MLKLNLVKYYEELLVNNFELSNFYKDKVKNQVIKYQVIKFKTKFQTIKM